MPASPKRESSQPLPAKTVRTGTTVNDMVRVLSEQIVHGVMEPGTRLDEGRLATRFGVSRTPVREALRELHAMGMVERSPNQRTIVTRVSGQRLQQMFETMAELEAVVAHLAAERMTRQERQTLQDIHDKSADLVRRGAIEEYKDYNAFFHRLLYAGCHNAYLQDLVILTKNRLAPFRRAQFELPDRLDHSWQEHAHIVAALLQGDGQAAARQARRHVLTVSQNSVCFASQPDETGQETA
jgi:DNA-binding GntR family transcriptional regulator